MINLNNQNFANLTLKFESGLAYSFAIVQTNPPPREIIED